MTSPLSARTPATGDSVPVEVRIQRANAASEQYGYPSRSLRMVGVTGTNGKTTTVDILRGVLDEPTARSASIGTLGVLIGREGEVIPGGAGLTTPGPEELQRLLRELADRGIRTVVMEVSSHALAQRRIHGVALDAAVFTNLTRDHLDYHGTTEAYFAAKGQLITYLKPDGVAIVNANDPVWEALPPAPRRITFGVDAGDVQANDVVYTSRGSEWVLRYGDAAAPVRLPLLSDFNVSNALAAAATVLALSGATQGEADATVASTAAKLSRTPQVPGRLEMIAEHPTVLRDYAHTPDALERALAAVRPFTRGKVIVVFGAGGDRDAGKRPIMGAIAEQRADVVIVTSDNPRTESPSNIVDDIERGMTAGRHERIEDRRSAIARALEIAGPEDVILLAGKGHETYQVIGTEKHPFDERQIVSDLLVERS